MMYMWGLDNRLGCLLLTALYRNNYCLKADMWLHGAGEECRAVARRLPTPKERTSWLGPAHGLALGLGFIHISQGSRPCFPSGDVHLQCGEASELHFLGCDAEKRHHLLAALLQILDLYPGEASLCPSCICNTLQTCPRHINAAGRVSVPTPGNVWPLDEMFHRQKWGEGRGSEILHTVLFLTTLQIVCLTLLAAEHGQRYCAAPGGSVVLRVHSSWLTQHIHDVLLAPDSHLADDCWPCKTVHALECWSSVQTRGPPQLILQLARANDGICFWSHHLGHVCIYQRHSVRGLMHSEIL